MKNITRAIFLVGLLMSPLLWAIDLSTAKTQGLVGETPSGYLAPVVAPTPEVATLIADINAKRKSHYQNIATKNGTSLAAIEKVAGETAIKKTAAGNFVLKQKKWTKK